MKKLAIKLLRNSARVPSRATSGSVGYDIYAAINEPLTIKPNETKMIPSGLSIALKRGYAAFIYARSSLGVIHHIIPANCVGVVDSDYRGEIIVALINNSKEEFTISPLDRIAQMVISKCELPEFSVSKELSPSERGSGGFGSTNKA